MKIPAIERNDMKKAGVAALIYAVITLFLFFFVSFTQPDPPITTIPVPMELSDDMIIEDFQVESVGTNGQANQGGGTPSNTKSDTPTPPSKGERVVSSDESDFTHNVGQGGNQNIENPQAPIKNADETFTFGTGGSGGGAGTGKGTMFGDGHDNTKGNGSGGGSGSGNRTVVQSPCPPSVGTEEGDIYLTVWVDENGKVIQAENISSKTTTSSTAVINAAIKGVVNCMRFDKRPGAPVSKISLSGPIRIRRN